MTAPSNANTSGLAPTDALRLVPTRDDGLRVGRAILEAHSQWEKEHGVTGAQNPWQEQHIILLGQAAILAAPASPLPGGGPHERWSILNHLGELWTPENFDTERQAMAYLDSWKRDNPKMDLSKHKVIPVLVTMTAAPTGEPK